MNHDEIAAMNIEFLEDQIDDLQKRIRLSYDSLHNDNMSDADRERINDEISHYRNLVTTYQAALRQKYQGIFKATHRTTVPRTTAY